MQPATHYHLSGVAGSGMNPLAQALIAQGFRVTGSDRYFDQGESLPVIDKLQAAGVEFFPQDGSALDDSCKGLVISTAIEADNPELLRATALGIPCLHRSEMLADLVQDKTCIAIAGTSGKTTTTGMVGYALEQLGRDPSVVNGGIIVNWASDSCIGNVRNGNSDLWVIEADESDKSLLNYTPEWAIISTISIDHFGLEETISLFRAFAARVKNAIICGPGVARLLEGATQAILISLPETPSNMSLRMPGKHNQLNAEATAMLCEAMGCDGSATRAALESFAGIERRLQRMDHGSIAVYDDFGHNPEKIAAAMHAVAPEQGQLFVGWKPHGYGPLKTMAEAMIRMFSEQEDYAFSVHVLPVYYVGGTTSRAMESEEFVAMLQQAGISASYAASYQELSAYWRATARPGDVCLSMGARDPELPHFARQLAQRLNPS